jgi:hypothetical protein
MQSDSNLSVFPSVPVQFCVAGKVAALCMACTGTSKWNFSDLKKVPESLDLQDFATIFRFSKFHF